MVVLTMNNARAVDCELTLSSPPLASLMTVPSSNCISPMRIVSSKRPMEFTSLSGCMSSDDESSHSTKKHKKVSPPNVSSDDESCKEKSHLQKKYDPENAQAMSKVELSLWRRQQRKQRNRISAAVSRQKQKSRIVELEQELAEWKEKVRAVQLQLEAFQEDKPSNNPSVQHQETLPTTNPVDLQVSPAPLPVFSSLWPSPNIVPSLLNQKPLKMISRQALSRLINFT